MAMGPQQEDIINKPKPKVRYRVSLVQEILLQGSHEKISVRGAILVPMAVSLT